MQIKIFTIPVFGSDALEDELNKFLRGHRILQVERHFCADNGGYWAVLIEYVDSLYVETASERRREKKDHTADLTNEERERFDFFRKRRREIAQEKSLPAYMVFTDAELAVLAKIPDLSEESAKSLKEINKSRLRDYGHYFYLVNNGEASGQSDATDSEYGKPTGSIS